MIESEKTEDELIDEALKAGDGEPRVYEMSLEDLEALPVLIQGQADDCHIDTGRERVWLSRCKQEDGEPWDNKVTIEHLVAGRWISVELWQAR